MAITAASVEANGWVLKLTLTGSLSSAIVSGWSLTDSANPQTQGNVNFGAYALNPNTTPALTLAATTSGYVQSAGTAVASSAVGRTLIATKTLRKVTNATAAGVRDARNPDEADNGDGTITVRIALSQHVYAGDTGLTLTALAGWRTGSGAQSGIAVTNNSTVAAPAPIVRWTDVPYQLQGGPFTLECVVASHHPNGLAPVAGVKFTVTDGTTVKTYWATALSTSTAYPAKNGDGTANLALRVYAVTVDPTTATALTKGLLRCDFTVYPWIGPAQTSDPAGTRSMTGLGTAASATAAFVPFVVAWNPGGAWITPRYAYVNASTGATTAAAANVSTSAATAAATPLATVNLAIESLRLDAVAHTSTGTVAAANGQAAITQSLDGCRIRLAAGVSFVGSQTVTAGVQTLATWLVIEGDPADANPRADCILRSAASVTSRVTRVAYANLSVEAGTSTVMAQTLTWLNNAELRGQSGQTTATTTPFGATNGLIYATNVKWWQYGLGAVSSGTTQSPVLLRAVQVERQMGAPVVLNCARLPSAIAGQPGVANIVSATDVGSSLERIILGNDLRYINGTYAYNFVALANANVPVTAPYSTNSLTLGTAFPVVSRQAAIDNVVEAIGSVGYPLFNGIGENNPSVSTENIIEGNTHTGDRVNAWYNDLNLATVALTDTTDSIARVNRLANNVYTKCASKHDEFNDPTVAAQRIGVALSATRNKAYAVGAEIVVAGSPANVYHCTTAGTTASTGGPTGTGSAISDGSVVWQWIATEARQHGYRPGAISAWSAHYGVGAEGNIDLAGVGDPAVDPNLIHEFLGVGSDRLFDDGTAAITAMPWTTDASGTPNRLACQTLQTTGGGNYKPLSTGSATYLLGRGRTANVDMDSLGQARAVPFTAGAIEGAAVIAIVPSGDRQASRAATSLTGWAATLGALRVAMASRAAASATGWSTTLGIVRAAMASRAAVALTGWSTTLGTTRTGMASRAAPSLTAWSVAVAAAGGALASRASATAAGWSALLVIGGGRLASRATAAALGWTTTFTAAAGSLGSLVAASVTRWLVSLAAGGDRSATAASPGTVTWAGDLTPDSDWLPGMVSAPIVTTAGSWLIVIDAGRIAIVDRTLPILLPGTTTPAERTLIVAGDWRTTCIA